MLILIIRTLILYITAIFSMRIMGKRQMGELQPSELVVAIMISDLASVPMQAIDIPLLSGIIPVLTLIVAEICLSFLASKSKLARKIFSGRPSILIYNGKINTEEMKRLRFSTYDLLEELRTNGYQNILDVNVAILETNGKLSIIPKPPARGVTLSDLNIVPDSFEGLPFILASEGSFNKNEIKRAGMTVSDADKILKEKGIKNVSEILIFSMDSTGCIFIQKKKEDI